MVRSHGMVHFLKIEKILTNLPKLPCGSHTRTGFICRRIKSPFHHSNWQHIFLISFNGTSKRGVMHYKKHCQFAWKIVDFQSLKALPIWRFLDHFYFKKSCDRLVHWTVINIGSNWRGDFFFLLRYLPLFLYSYIMSYDKKCHKVHVLWTFCVNGLRNTNKTEDVVKCMTPYLEYWRRARQYLTQQRPMSALRLLMFSSQASTSSLSISVSGIGLFSASEKMRVALAVHEKYSH